MSDNLAQIAQLLTSNQLVVVGDQSSGKSSSLDGLTGPSFPVASDLCTRFATQIVLCRTAANDAAVRISIIPGPAALGDPEKKAHLANFEQCLKDQEFGSDELQNSRRGSTLAVVFPSFRFVMVGIEVKRASRVIPGRHPVQTLICERLFGGSSAMDIRKESIMPSLKPVLNKTRKRLCS
jgi:Dynamin family